MAKNVKKKQLKSTPKIAETAGSNFGNYKEENGGGTPKGGVWGGTDGRVGWAERESRGEVSGSDHRESQPRTKDGKFTYNSVNGKETKYESRGETVNPLLTGGKNGIKISTMKKQFTDKSGELYDTYKGYHWTKGSEKVSGTWGKGGKLHTAISKQDIWDIARVSWNIEKGEFTGESEAWETKRGARSQAAKRAVKKAGKSHHEEFVKDDDGGLKRDASVNADGARPTTGIKFKFPSSITKKIYELKKVRDIKDRISTTGSIKPTSEVKYEAPKSPIPEEKPSGNIYTHEKERPITPGIKYGEKEMQKVLDVVGSSDATPEEKKIVDTLFRSGDKKQIDDLIDVIKSSGLVEL